MKSPVEVNLSRGFFNVNLCSVPVETKINNNLYPYVNKLESDSDLSTLMHCG